MLAADVELVDLDGRHLRNWYRLLLPPGVQGQPSWAAVFVEEGRVVHAIAAPAGALAPEDIELAGTDRASLSRLKEQLGVGAVAVLETGAMARLHADIDGELAIDDDLVAQGLVILRALKRLSGSGVWLEPHLLDMVPAPRYEALQKTFDLLIPDGSALLAYVLADDGRGIEASVIATKHQGDITLATTHLAIADLVDEAGFARDWRGGYKRVLRAVEDRFARPSVAVFVERATFDRIVTGPPDQLARELNRKNVVIDPAPTWLLGLLGGATMAAFATRGARALARYVPPSARRMAADLATSANDMMHQSGAHPFALLGFDPIELWHNLRHYYRR